MCECLCKWLILNDCFTIFTPAIRTNPHTLLFYPYGPFLFSSSSRSWTSVWKFVRKRQGGKAIEPSVTLELSEPQLTLHNVYRWGQRPNGAASKAALRSHTNTHTDTHIKTHSNMLHTHTHTAVCRSPGEWDNHESSQPLDTVGVFWKAEVMFWHETCHETWHERRVCFIAPDSIRLEHQMFLSKGCLKF